MNTPDRFAGLRQLYPGLSDVQLEEVEENLDRYLAIVMRIVERGSDSDFDRSAKATLP